MRSGTPKVLHPLCGRPMILHVLDALVSAPARTHRRRRRPRRRARDEDRPGAARHRDADRVRRADASSAAPVTRSSVGLTAFADELDGEDDVLVVSADAPLLRPETLADARHRAPPAATPRPRCSPRDSTTRRATGVSCATRTATSTASSSSRTPRPRSSSIDEVNPSIYCFRRGLLAPALRRLEPRERAGRVLPHRRDRGAAPGRARGRRARGRRPHRGRQVNDRAQLAVAEAELRSRINDRWMREGVSMVDPSRTYIDAIGRARARRPPAAGHDPRGAHRGHGGSVIGPDVQLVDTIVGRDAVIRQTVAFESEIGDRVTVGPYVSLRAGHPRGRRRARRHVRRDEEHRDR